MADTPENALDALIAAAEVYIAEVYIDDDMPSFVACDRAIGFIERLLAVVKAARDEATFLPRSRMSLTLSLTHEELLRAEGQQDVSQVVLDAMNAAAKEGM